ncbi:hypothetical protein [Nocardia sp. NPDC058114]|uniref:hypothetical protein n=1 Tax=Nocardia sp. NPDC058114 TaxID=3346346 RepID=UPI0036D8C363
MAESLVTEAVDKQFLESHRPVASAVRGRRPVGDAAVAAVAAPGWVGIGAEGGKAAVRRWAKHLIVNIDESRATRARHPSACSAA